MEEAVTNIKEAICTYINASEDDEIAVPEERFESLLVDRMRKLPVHSGYS